MDEEYEKRVSIYLICDGIDKLDDKFLKSAKESGIYDEIKLREKAFDVKGDQKMSSMSKN